MTDDEYARHADECCRELDRRQQGIAEVVAFGHDLDFDGGRVRYLHEDTCYLEAQVLAVGSRGLRSGTWLWAWANASASRERAAESRVLRELASVTGRPEFAAGRPFPASAAEARRYAAIACRHVGGLGVVRFEANGSDWIFVVTRLAPQRPEEEIVAVAQAAVRRTLEEGAGPGQLNLLRKRFPSMRIELIDADLRGRPRPWAHDLHLRPLVEMERLQAGALRELGREEELGTGRFGSHERQDLSGADFSHARLDGAILRDVSLRGASLEGASLVETDLSGADLRGASLRHAFLDGANLARAHLAEADVAGAELSRTLLADVDLSKVKGLDDVHHLGPSEISMSTLIASGFEIEPAFLRSAGVSRGLILDLMRGRRFKGSYQTCFLSYSSKDAGFAGLLHAALVRAGVRVFWDHFDLVPGESLDAQIAEAIREHRRLIVVLSPNSMASAWVEREVKMAWRQRRDALLPVRLCPIEDVQAWIAAREGLPDLASLFPIQDFTAWRDEGARRHAVSMLLAALAGGVDLRQAAGAAPAGDDEPETG